MRLSHVYLGDWALGCFHSLISTQTFRRALATSVDVVEVLLYVHTSRRLIRDGSPGRKLQALVYDILPSATAVFSYAIGPRKLSANEQVFFCWCSNSSKFVRNNSNKTRRVIYSRQQSLHQHK